MKSEEITSALAGREFIEKVVITSCYENTLSNVRSQFVDGPPGGVPDVRHVALHRWFAGLLSDDQEKVMDIVAYAVDLSLFHLLNVLDGTSSPWPVEGVNSDYAVYLQTYKDDQDEKINSPDRSVRINPIFPPSSQDYLHDVFSELMESQDH